MWQCCGIACISPAVLTTTTTTLSPSLPGHRPDWIDAWSGLEPGAYERKKEEVADAILARLERVFPGITAGTLFRCGRGGRQARCGRC